MQFNSLETQTLIFHNNDNSNGKPGSNSSADALRSEYFDTRADNAATIRANFKLLDTDGSGGLSKKELTDAFNDKYALPGVHEASKMLLDNYDSATHMSGNKKAFFLDFSEQAFLTGDTNKSKKLNNEVAPSDLNLIIASSSAAGDKEMQSHYNEHEGFKNKALLVAGADGTLLPITGLAANSFMADATLFASTAAVSTTAAVCSGAAFVGAAVVGGAVAVGAYNDYQRAKTRTFSSVIENELDARRKMLSSWTL